MPDSEADCRKMLVTLDGLGKTYSRMLVVLSGLLAEADTLIGDAIRRRGLWRQHQAELGKQQKIIGETIRQLTARLNGSGDGDEWKNGSCGESECED